MLRHHKGFQAAIGLVLCWAAPAGAQIIEADASGEENLTDPRYYGVSFLSAGPTGDFVESVSFDISADIDGVFDLDGVTNFGNALEPVVQVSSLVGLAPGDITWSFSGNQPNVITANFAPGSFGVGDEFRFACETDLFVADPCPGGSFANGGALFSAKLEHGPLATGSFGFINKEVSVATADFSNCNIALALPDRSIEPGGWLVVDVSAIHKPKTTVKTPVNIWLFDVDGGVMATWQSPEFTLNSGTQIQVSHRFTIPAGTPPGIYEVGTGIGEMRQGLILRTMEFRVEAPKPVQAGGMKALK